MVSPGSIFHCRYYRQQEIPLCSSRALRLTDGLININPTGAQLISVLPQPVVDVIAPLEEYLHDLLIVMKRKAEMSNPTPPAKIGMQGRPFRWRNCPEYQY
jgi:hypothetical protein